MANRVTRPPAAISRAFDERRVGIPDPRNTINPETGRPIGEDRIAPLTRRVPPEHVAEDIEEAGNSEPDADRSVPRPRRFSDLMEAATVLILERLTVAQGESEFLFADVMYGIDSRYGSSDPDDFRMIDAVGELLQESQHRLLNIGIENEGWLHLSVLDLGTDTIFVVFDQTGLEADIAIVADSPRSQHTALLAECEFRIGMFMGVEPFIIPTTIEYFGPLTDRTVKQSVRSAIESWSKNESDIQLYRDYLLAADPVLTDEDMSDPNVIATLYADLIVIRGEDGSLEGTELWGFDPPSELVDTIECLLQDPDLPIESRPESDRQESLSSSEQRRISESRLEAMRRGEYHIVDTNKPGWEEAAIDALFGTEGRSRHDDDL